jgi:hypothetical protein
MVDALAAAGDTTRARSMLAEVLVLGNWYESVTLVARVAPDALVRVLDDLESRCVSVLTVTPPTARLDTPLDCARHDQEIAVYERWARPVIEPMLLRAGRQGEEDNSTENVCRAIRPSRCSCVRCFYCERALASRRHEHDHFPIPARLAATEWCQPAWTATN